jgi:tRNA (guanosine-2'-O-)-methyltransferase
MLNDDRKVLEEFYKIITPNKCKMFDRIAAERTRFLTVVLEDSYQEHNASAVIRSCDCFGIQDLHIIEKQFEYKIKRDIALGAGRWVDMKHHRGPDSSIQAMKHLKSIGYKLVATTPHTDDESIFTLPIDEPLALIFGTERKGVSDQVLEQADAYVRIPMYGFTESFNLSVSVALTLQALRQRLEKDDVLWKLNEPEQIALKIKWCKSILNGGAALEQLFRTKKS